jgi:TRAP-type C4-dicarboxylate transport system, small permease component
MADLSTEPTALEGWRLMLDRFGRRLEQALDVVLVIMLTVLVASLVWQVIGRYVFSKAPGWSEELARFLMVWVVMLGSAAVMRQNGHISVSVLVDACPPGLRKLLLAVRDVIVLATVYVLFSYGINLATLLKGQLSPAFEVTMALPYSALPAGAILIGLTVILARLTRSPYAEGTSTPIT